jgi:hypothetical protein
MVNSIAVCGDSFSVGHGLDPENQFEKSFGGLVAEKYNLPLKVYGRSGCCNFVIYLQVKKILEQIDKDKTFRPLVVVSDTWADRLIFSIRKSWFDKAPDLEDVDYLNYEPYRKDYAVPRSLSFKPSKKYRYVSEGLPTYLDGEKFGLEQLMDKSRPENISPLSSFFDEVYDYGIKRETDKCIIASAHYMLVQRKIPHVFLTREKNSLIDSNNNIINNWEKLTKKYPDSRGTGHCNELGHEIVAQKIIKQIDTQHLLSNK